MKQLHRTIKRLTVAITASLPGVALAGASNEIITLAPVTGAAVAVPTLSSNMMIALALLLAVVGLRIIRQSQAAHRVIGILILGGGVALTSLEIQESNAAPSQPALAVSNDEECKAAEINVTVAGAFALQPQNAGITNNCPTALEIIKYSYSDCAQFGNDTDTYSFKPNGAPVGAVIKAGDTLRVGYCEQDNLR